MSCDACVRYGNDLDALGVKHMPEDCPERKGAAMSEDRHPFRVGPGKRGYISSAVTLRAYEVYSAVFRPQRALVSGDCRGGFSAVELIGFLYARSFPREEWRARFEEAMNGLEGCP